MSDADFEFGTEGNLSIHRGNQLLNASYQDGDELDRDD
jgi:hypothetical protein